MRKFKAFLVIMTAILLTSCGNGGNEVTEISAASETTSATTATTTEATTEATETNSEAATTTSEATESTSETFTTAEADYAELYGITAEETEIEESIKNKKGLTACNFDASYPIFSGGDEAIIGKINGAVKEYIDGAYSEEKKKASENEEEEKFREGVLWLWERQIVYGLRENREDYYTYRINGNLLSVYFDENYYYAGTDRKGMPTVLTFDLRTGEQIDWNGLIEDKKGFAVFLDSVTWFCADSDDFDNSETYAANYREKPYEEYFADTFERMAANGNDEMYSGGIILYSDGGCGFESSRLTLENGCVCYWLGTHHYGYSDVLRCVRIPVEYVLPYMNDKGRDCMGLS